RDEEPDAARALPFRLLPGAASRPRPGLGPCTGRPDAAECQRPLAVMNEHLVGASLEVDGAHSTPEDRPDARADARRSPCRPSLDDGHDEEVDAGRVARAPAEAYLHQWKVFRARKNIRAPAPAYASTPSTRPSPAVKSETPSTRPVPTTATARSMRSSRARAP